MTDDLNVGAADDEKVDASIQGRDPRQDAGRDASIAKRLAKNPHNEQAKLDSAIDESMDASDAPSITQPGRNDPAPSSGYDEAAEKALKDI